MRTSNREAGLLAAATTALLSAVSVFFNVITLQADTCGDVGDRIGRECSGEPEGCVACVGASCGVYAGPDEECYVSCYQGGMSTCS
jgi:hypothetical protein